MTRVVLVLIAAAIANVLGWVLPVVDDKRGWVAFRVALSPLVPYEQYHIEQWRLVLLSVSSSFTNVLFWVVAIALLRGLSRRASRLCLWLAAGATLLNLHWTVTMGDSANDLEIGYFVWVVSFALLALAAFLELAKTASKRAA
jgi:hypothetical protein